MAALLLVFIHLQKTFKTSRAKSASNAVLRLFSLFYRVDTSKTHGEDQNAALRCASLQKRPAQHDDVASLARRCSDISFSQLETNATSFTHLAKQRGHCYYFVMIFALFSKRDVSCSWLSLGGLEQKRFIAKLCYVAALARLYMPQPKTEGITKAVYRSLYPVIYANKGKWRW